MGAYSKEFKDQVLKDLWVNNLKDYEIVEKYQISKSCIYKWKKQNSSDRFLSMIVKKEKRPQDWTPKERLDAIIKTAGLSDSELGKWCRENGLHTHNIAQWREFALQATSNQSSQNQKPYREENKKLKKENKTLKKELQRKEKALAEATTLLVLKKKAKDLWGDPEED